MELSYFQTLYYVEGHKGGVLFTVHEENKGPITVHEDNKHIYSTLGVNS